MQYLVMKIDGPPVWRDGKVKLRDNITVEEVACNCGCRQALVDHRQLDLMQGLRDIYGPIRFDTSWFRCPNHNDSLGSGDYSSHPLGQATDIVHATEPRKLNPKYMSESFTKEFIENAVALGAKEIGFYYDSQFIHVSIKNTKPFNYDGFRVYTKGGDPYGINI